MSDQAWQEPGSTLGEMLLTEPGSRVEGPTEDLMRVLFYVTWQAGIDYGLSMTEADQLALKVLPRIHQALGDAGLIVRDLANEP